MKHLWEIKHPYYMCEGNYYYNDCHTAYETLDAFMADWRDVDLDYNWLVRWDWIEGPGDDDWVRPVERPDTYLDGVLKVQFVGQRKARLWSCEIKVCRHDEPRVREYLQEYADYMVRMWEGFDMSPTSEGIR